MRSLLSGHGSLEASRSAVYSSIDSSLTSSSKHGACAISTSRIWSNRRPSILPRCRSRLKMADTPNSSLPSSRDFNKPMMSKGKSFGSMRQCSPSHPMQLTSGVGASKTFKYHASPSVLSTLQFVLQSVRDMVSNASLYMMRRLTKSISLHLLRDLQKSTKEKNSP